MTALISIIVPVYGVEAYLGRCMESLLSQTYENIEIILVDDGSPDNCPALCDAYKAQDARVRVIHQENAGLSGARNTGLCEARGEYIAFVDSDDYVAADYIKTLYELLVESESDISQCKFAYVSGEPLESGKSRSYKVYRGESLMEQLYGPEQEATYFVVAWNKLYKRELFSEIRYPKGRIHEDEATTYRLFDKAKKLAFTERVLYGYFTENTGSITSVFSKKRLDWLLAHEERIAFFLEAGYERLLPVAYKKLCDACITFSYRCTEQVEDATYVKAELRRRLTFYRTKGRAWISQLPLRTRIGYRIYEISPILYQRLLKGL